MKSCAHKCKLIKKAIIHIGINHYTSIHGGKCGKMGNRYPACIETTDWAGENFNNTFFPYKSFNYAIQLLRVRFYCAPFVSILLTSCCYKRAIKVYFYDGLTNSNDHLFWVSAMKPWTPTPRWTHKLIIIFYYFICLFFFFWLFSLNNSFMFFCFACNNP